VRRVGFREGVVCNSSAVFEDDGASADRAQSWLSPRVTRGLPHEYRDIPRIRRIRTPVAAVPPSTSLASFL